MSKIKTFMNRMNTKAAKVGIALTVGTAGAMAASGVSGATGTGTVLDDQFTSAQTSVLSELALGATLLIAITLFVVGITVLVKWLRKGSKQTAG